MEYDFETRIDRRGSSCAKWDLDMKITGRSGLLPFWVADMDFRAAPAIQEALRKRMEHGVFGYTERPESLDEAMMAWFSRRQGWNIHREQIVESPGIVPFIHMAVQAFTEPGDSVVIQEPVYYPFRQALERNHRKAAVNPLLSDEEGTWRMDLPGLEQMIDGSGASLMVLSSPHNPVGRVWREDELLALADICREKGVMVISDEIHADLIQPGYRQIPWLTLPSHRLPSSISLVSPTKTFNIPGLNTAYAVIPDPDLRRKTHEALSALGQGGGSSAPLSYAAAEAAWRKSEGWLEALLVRIRDNDELLRRRFAEAVPELRVAALEGTYLEWLNVENSGFGDNELWERLLNAGVWLSKGRQFGRGGTGHLRMNIACPRNQLEEGLGMMLRAF